LKKVVPKCDLDQASNPQFCSDYAGEIQDYMKSIERFSNPSQYFMQRQTDLNEKMRMVLIDWLVEVHLKFKMQPETLYITINLIDRYLENERATKSTLQLVGITSMMIAAKYEEIYPPEVKDFVFITDNAYTKQDLLTMEFKILNAIQFDLTFPTSFRFL